MRKIRQSRLPFYLLAIAALATVALLNGGSAEAGPNLETSAGGIQPARWSRQLPADSCPNTSDTNCHYSSPALADINGDGNLDVVSATNKGYVVVVKHDGTLLWQTDVAPAFGMAPGTEEIASSPAVADIDSDGHPEIVVGTGTIFTSVCTQGGVVVLDHQGKVQAGWPQLADDWEIAPSGCRDSVFASPALGDLDNDGDMEIVAGGFDKRIYAWHHNGTALPGFSPDSYLASVYPTWPNLRGRLADTVWGSPVLADVDYDGYLDVIIATDEGNRGNDWECPYRLPPGWMSGYCGGSIYALNRFGQLLPGFPRHTLEAMQSTPAIGDINGDGLRDIVVGTGSYYYLNSPDHPRDGFRVYAIDGQGRDLPGWEGGRAVGGPVPASPVMGDITGDGEPEVVVSVMEERRIYAWSGNGQLVSGFPMKPVDNWGNALGNYDVGSSLVLADYDGDDKMEIFLNQGWVVTVVDGNGQQITSPVFPNYKQPIYLADGSLLNNPAVGDVDNDGQLELVAQNSKLFLWEMPDAGAKSDWAMFKRDAQGGGSAPIPPRLSMASEELYVLHPTSRGTTARTSFTIRNFGDDALSWRGTASDGISIVPTSGTVTREQTVEVTIDTSKFREGTNQAGIIEISATAGGQPVLNSPLTLPVVVNIGDFSTVFLPTVVR